ncbi:MAG TPA: TIGR02444 family protein [Stellaceae bacterium]
MSRTEPDSEPPPDALRRFAVDFYARPGVAAACLALQDRHGFDVILILFACWIGCSGRGRLTAADLAAAAALAEPWRRAVIAPLRVVRRHLQSNGEAAELYQTVKAAELAAELRALDRLAALAPAPDPATAPVADALANLSLYLGAAAEAAAPLRLALASPIHPDP